MKLPRITQLQWNLPSFTCYTRNPNGKKHAANAQTIAKSAAEQVKVGAPDAEGTTIGPVVSEVQFDKIQNLIQKGIDEGAKLETGGTGRPDGLNAGYYIKPTVFSNVTNDMTIAQEEIFGPVLTIIPYDTEEEAIEIANDSIFGLSGAVWSGDDERAKARCEEDPNRTSFGQWGLL